MCVWVCVCVSVRACVGGVCPAHLALLARCRLPRYVLRQPFHLVWRQSGGLVKCHSRRRVCIVCGGKWVEWDVTSGGYEKITRVEYWQITAE